MLPILQINNILKYFFFCSDIYNFKKSDTLAKLANHISKKKCNIIEFSHHNNRRGSTICNVLYEILYVIPKKKMSKFHHINIML
jgi:hypothetical protein